MCTRILDMADGILDAADGHLSAACAEWSRLTLGDLARIANKQDLITAVEERYSISHRRAVKDVDLWDDRVRRMDSPIRHHLDQWEL